jgi:hypothetical protein
MPWIEVSKTPVGAGLQTLFTTSPGSGWKETGTAPPAYTPSTNFSDSRNSGYIVLLEEF